MMRGLVFEGPGRMRLSELATPRPGAGEVLVRVGAATICGTDVRIFTGRKTREVRTGHPIGHECAGTVAAVGAGVNGVTVGERVGVCVVVTCGACDQCDAGRENLCAERITLGYHTDGAFAEYMLIPARAVARGNLFALPEGVGFEAAALCEPLACCLNGQHEMGMDATVRSVVIFGAGPIGGLHVLLAKREPGRSVTVVEPQAHRRETAMAFGADACCAPDDFAASEQFDAAILATGRAELFELALRAVRGGGRVNLFAGFDAGALSSVDPNLIHYKQIRVTGATESRRRDYAEALSLVGGGAFDVTRMITHRYRLEEHEQAFKAASQGMGLKVGFTMGS